MTDPLEHMAETRALWRRFRGVESGGVESGREMMALAALAEGRLGPAERAVLETALETEPDRGADVAAARLMAGRSETTAPVPPADVDLDAIIARASGLVPPRAARILPFDRREAGRKRNLLPPPWAQPLRWGALAATLALVSWLGAAMGSDAYRDVAALDQTNGLGADLIDPPTGFFEPSDTSGT